jgi:hypothetical protein
VTMAMEPSTRMTKPTRVNAKYASDGSLAAGSAYVQPRVQYQSLRWSMQASSVRTAATPSIRNRNWTPSIRATPRVSK